MLRVAIQELTDELIRLRVAELLGWRRCENRKNQGTWYGQRPPEYNGWSLLPDYPNDLNACHEMEETLNESGQDRFTYLLSILVGEGNAGYRWRFARATARQRCEAFILTGVHDEEP